MSKWFWQTKAEAEQDQRDIGLVMPTQPLLIKQRQASRNKALAKREASRDLQRCIRKAAIKQADRAEKKAVVTIAKRKLEYWNDNTAAKKSKSAERLKQTRWQLSNAIFTNAIFTH